MLATGGSLSWACQKVKESGATDITALCVVTAPDGVTRMYEDHPDVRIVAATNVDLGRNVDDKSFRLDLYHRLNTLTIELPALRERPEDIAPLVVHFLQQLGRGETTLTDAALGELVSNWLDHGGRIQKLACQYRGMDLPERTMTLGGTVKRKWEENGQRFAELELYARNEEGKNTTPGSSIVRLDG